MTDDKFYKHLLKEMLQERIELKLKNGGNEKQLYFPQENFGLISIYPQPISNLNKEKTKKKT